MSDLATERERIGRWLARRIAERRGLAEEQVGWHQPFTELGLASLDLVALAVELGVWLGREVETTLLFSRPDVEQVTAALTEDAGGPDGARARTTARQEPLAIVGLACRFPGAPDAKAFWQLLASGEHAIGDVPAWRWGPETFLPGEPCPGKAYVRSAGFVDGIDRFDAAFFGISAREARLMDPQHRLLLMTAWHALEDAGIAPSRLAATRTGVFVGIGGAGDYFGIMEQAGVERDAYFGTGVSTAIAANRLSYLLDLRGPSLTIDTTCSSSLVALHQARASLLNGESDAAIVAGVNVIVCAGGMVTMSQSRMLSPTARCHTFDEKADGYVRGEGCGVLFLKRFSDALRDGDRIQALVVGTAINQDGRSAGLTVPNGEAQVRLMREALAAAQLDPQRVSYLEAHGTGTPLGDPIEMSAIKQVYGAVAVEDGDALHIGSVKTNIGHLEAAAGIAGVIKVVLALQRQEIPKHLHFEKLNPHITLEGSRCRIASEPTGWPMSLKPRYAAVSSFGIGGTNAHAVLQDAPPTDLLRAPGDNAIVPGVLVLSAFDAETLVAQAKRHARCVAESEASWLSLCHTAAAGRAHHAHRLAVVACDAAEASIALSRWAEGQEVPEVLTGTAPARRMGKQAFLFTGQGAQYVGMGESLYRHHAGFFQALQECDELFLPWLGRSVAAMLYPQDVAECDLLQTLYAQPALFSLEYALAHVWLQAGVRPDALLGHSLGEYVAATIAGVFSLGDAVRLVAHRARLMQECSPTGAMAAVHAAPEVLERLLALPRDARVALAARNTPQEIVMSGDETALDVVLAQWRAEGAGITKLHVTRAFHSPLMQEMAIEFAQVAQTVSYHAPRIPLVSNLSGRLAGDEIATADYWVRHTLEPVAFCEGVASLAALGSTRFIEIGPHPVLSAAVRQMQPQALALPSLRRGHDSHRSMLEAWARWHVDGGAIDWQSARRHASGGDVPPIASLPPYPFRRDRHWFCEGNSPVPGRQAVAAPAQEDPVHAALKSLPARTVEAIAPLVQDFLLRRLATVLRLTEAERAGLQPEFSAKPLASLGLDSLMAVELRHSVLQTIGVAVPTVKLLDGTPTGELAAYIAGELVNGKSATGRDTTQIELRPEARFQPFRIGPLSTAFFKAACGAWAGGDLPTELYAETAFEAWDPVRFEAALNRLIQRHDVLRGAMEPDGRCRIRAEVPPYRIGIDDLSSFAKHDRERALQVTRQTMCEEVLDASRWPMFEVKVSVLGGGMAIVHARFNIVVIDTRSFGLLIHEWQRFYEEPAWSPEPLSIGYRDYMETLSELRRTEALPYRVARQSSLDRLGGMYGSPTLERVADLPDTARYVNLHGVLPAAAWNAFRKGALRCGVTPSAAVMAIYAAVLHRRSNSDRFTFGVYVAQRLPLHPQVDQLVGDFTSLLLMAVAVEAEATFSTLALSLQRQLAAGMEHLLFDGVEAWQAAGIASTDDDRLAPDVMFNSMLPLQDDGAAEATGFGDTNFLFGRTSRLRLEMQTSLRAGELHYGWDVRASSFPAGMPESMFDECTSLLHALASDESAWNESALAHRQEATA